MLFIQLLISIIILSISITQSENTDEKVLCLVATHRSGASETHELSKLICDNCKNIILNIDGLKDERCINNDNAYIVHSIRNPVDVLISGYIHHKSNKENWANRTPLEPGLHVSKKFSLLGIIFLMLL